MAINLKCLEPMPPEEGPPLPEGLSSYLPFKGYWPWYKPMKTLVSIKVTTGITPAIVESHGYASQQFVATGTYSDGTTADITAQVTWISSNVTAATIDNTGLLTGVSPGNTNITASLSGIVSPAVSYAVQSQIVSGASNFTVSVINLPAGAKGFDCSFTDPSTGTIYTPTNSWVPGNPIPSDGVICFGPSESAQFSVPVSTGLFSIFAPASGGSQTGNAISLPNILASAQLTINVIDGGAYTFDFSNQQFS